MDESRPRVLAKSVFSRGLSPPLQTNCENFLLHRPPPPNCPPPLPKKRKIFPPFSLSSLSLHKTTRLAQSSVSIIWRRDAADRCGRRGRGVYAFRVTDHDDRLEKKEKGEGDSPTRP